MNPDENQSAGQPDEARVERGYDADRAEAAAKLWKKLVQFEGEDADAHRIIEHALKSSEALAVAEATAPLLESIDLQRKSTIQLRDIVSVLKEDGTKLRAQLEQAEAALRSENAELKNKYMELKCRYEPESDGMS